MITFTLSEDGGDIFRKEIGNNLSHRLVFSIIRSLDGLPMPMLSIAARSQARPSRRRRRWPRRTQPRAAQNMRSNIRSHIPSNIPSNLPLDHLAVDAVVVADVCQCHALQPCSSLAKVRLCRLGIGGDDRPPKRVAMLDNRDLAFEYKGETVVAL